MKALFIGLFFVSSVSAQVVWERNDKSECVELKYDVNEIRDQLKTQYKKDCDYDRHATKVIIGHLFSCPGKIHPYFRSKEACDMFFAEGKKDLVKFAPAGTAEPKKWIKNFGSCMETATPGQYTKMGPKDLNSFCQCVATKTKVKVDGFIIQECSKQIQ